MDSQHPPKSMQNTMGNNIDYRDKWFAYGYVTEPFSRFESYDLNPKG